MTSRNNLEPSVPAGVRAPSVARKSASSVSVRPHQENDEITFGFLLEVWSRWWKYLIPASLMLAIATSSIAWFTFKPKFKADARLEIAEQSPWVIFRDDDSKALGYVATQIETLRSPRVLSAAMSDPIVAGMPELRKKRDPVKWLMEKGLTIESIGLSNYIGITYAGRDAETSAHLVNTIIEKYFLVQNDQKTRGMQKILELLRESKKGQDAVVSRWQDRVKKLAENLDVMPNLTGMGVVVNSTNPAQQLMSELIKAEFSYTGLQAEVAALQSSLANDALAIAPELVMAKIDELPEIAVKRLEVQSHEAMLASIEQTAKGGSSSHQYLAQQTKLEGLKNALNSLRESSRATVEAEVRAMDRAMRQQELDRKQTEMEAGRQLVQRLEQRYKEKRDELSNEGNARLEFEFATQELVRARSHFATISEREAQVSAELGAPPRSEIFRGAVANYEPIVKYPVIELGASLAGSLLLPFAFAFVWEKSVRRISSVEQLESKTNATVIGEVSRLPARRNRRSKLLGQELGLFEESIDSLRTGLLLSEDGQDVQVLAVCSAVSGEGKTSVASQLAVSIARATAQPVLLIDGDMRAPDIHQIFEIPLSPGLSNVLDKEVSLEDAINRSWSEHVHLLPAGELTKSPHKLLGMPALQKLLDEARMWYRYVVIDTPPVLAASESLVIAKAADGTIVCTMRDFSRESHVRLAHARLQATGAETIGTVLSGVPVRSYASRYGTYGRYAYANVNK